MMASSHELNMSRTNDYNMVEHADELHKGSGLSIEIGIEIHLE